MEPQAVFANFRDAVANHYFDMNGRVGRAQFWYFVLAYFVFAIIAAILQAIVYLPLAAIFHLAMLLPAAGMGARRLQDIGRDGRLVWLFILFDFASQIVSALAALSFLALGFFSFFLFGPSVMLINLALFVAGIVLLYFWCQPGDPGANAYGPPPPVFEPNVRPAV